MESTTITSGVNDVELNIHTQIHSSDKLNLIILNDTRKARVTNTDDIVYFQRDSTICNLLEWKMQHMYLIRYRVFLCSKERKDVYANKEIFFFSTRSNIR